jgi:hypothetical protein
MKEIIRYGLAAAIIFLVGIRVLESADGGKEDPEITSGKSARQERLLPSAAEHHRVRFQQIAAGRNETLRDAELRELAISWVKANPENALGFAIELPAGELRDSFLRDLLVAWAKSDAPAALQWSDQRPAESDRRTTRETICIAVAETDPRHALELAVGHDADQDESGSLLGNLAMQWAEVDQESALAWVKGQPAGEWHDRLIARVAFILSKSDPHAAACSVAGDMEPGPQQTEAIISVLHQWAKVDVERAAAWVADFPPGDLRDRALGELRCAYMLSTQGP